MPKPKHTREHSTTRTAVPSGPHKLRIIGGRWRGTRLIFPAIDAIRPSPDRVRETLFNWLQTPIVGASCLDLFAGSGALGFEALSRGAASVVFVDREPAIGRYLRETIVRLKAENAQAIVADAERYLATAAHKFDVVFLDPPFGKGLTAQLFDVMVARDLLAAQAMVYLECEAELGIPSLPSGWLLAKSKRAGQVGYHLAIRST
jgi:16S rRNA (guanine966-N2)-methyltransferase